MSYFVYNYFGAITYIAKDAQNAHEVSGRPDII